MSTEIFTELDIIPSEPPVRFTKPWFARGWVVSIILATIATLTAVYGHFFHFHWEVTWLFISGALWIITIRKYLYGVRMIEIYPQIVWVYAKDPVKPHRELPFESMTVVNDLDELFIIRKGKFFNGIYLKKVYWGKSWHQMYEYFNQRASYVRFQSVMDKDNNTAPAFPGQVVSYRRDPKEMFSSFVTLFELIIGIVFWPLHSINEKSLFQPRPNRRSK